MPFDLNTIKEYLVGLGFKVDSASYAKFEQTLKNVSKLAEEHTTKMSKAYVKGAAVVVSALASITTATLALMERTAQADLNYQVFATRMFMATEQARRLKIALDALGRPLEEIMWNPELRERFKELMRMGGRIEGGRDIEQNLRFIRDIGFEITMLRTSMTYAMRYISSYIVEFLRGPGRGLLDWLRGINDSIQKNMPIWTRYVAQFLSQILMVVRSGGKAVGDLLGLIKELMGIFTSGRYGGAIMGVGLAAGAFLAVGAIPVIGPFLQGIMMASAALTALLLLIDDFYAYKEGRPSLLGGNVWGPMAGLMKDVAGFLKNIVSLFHELDQMAPGGMFSRIIQGLSAMAKIAMVAARAMLALADAAVILMRGEGKAAASARIDVARRDINRELLGEVETGPAVPGSRADIVGAAFRVQQKTGIPSAWILGQWWHETGGFKSRAFTELSNLAGIKGPGGGYRKFGSISEFGDVFADLIMRRYPGAMSAKTPEQYAAALKQGGYFEDILSNYQTGIRRGMAHAPGVGEQYVGDVNVYVTQPGATADEIKRAVIEAVEEKERRKISRQTREFSSPAGD